MQTVTKRGALEVKAEGNIPACRVIGAGKDTMKLFPSCSDFTYNRVSFNCNSSSG